jgi:rubrerythrin
MADLKGTKTEQNLKDAFAGESQARGKYTYYASQARKEGYEQIAAFFEETAFNEQEHAKVWFKLLHQGIPSTTENLKDAAGGENYEWTDMYKSLPKTPGRKALTISQPFLKKWALSKRARKGAIRPCWATSTKEKCLSAAKRWSGIA